ncbi:MAG: porin family protein [Gammaproteobacteria bacterium]|nr:porin family protein [Gammaproteobacteria bacterium]MCW5583332.1 porin family protein [Gammaproteobacteria bacterium]
MEYHQPNINVSHFSIISAFFVTFFFFMPQLTAASTANYQIRLYGGFSHAYTSTNKLVIDSPIEDETDFLHNTNSGNDGTAGIGFSYNFLPTLALADDSDDCFLQDTSVGMDLFFLNTTNSGIVYQFENPNFDNYHYDLKLKTLRIMLNGELGFQSPLQDIIPYLQASVGIARIRTSYDETPRTEEGISDGNIQLSSKTNYSFAYSLGTGVKIMLASNVQLSISYLYTNFGSTETATRSNNVVLTKPINVTLRTHTGLVGLIYSFA